MIRSLWIARTGLDAQQTQMDVIANNLANVSTNGFKRARAVFEDLLYQTIRQPGAQSSQSTQIPSGLQLGSGARPVSTARIHTQGAFSKPVTIWTWRSMVPAFSRCCYPMEPRRIRVTDHSRRTIRGRWSLPMATLSSQVSRFRPMP